jgi:hypothetical protein
MGNLTVGDLRKLIENVPDETPIVGDECDHMYRQLWESGTGYTTVLDDGSGGFVEDMFITEFGDGIGEETEYGKRIRAFVIA